MHDKTKCFSFFAMYVMQPYMHLCVAHIKAESSRRPHSELGAVVWTMNRSCLLRDYYKIRRNQ